MALSAAWRCGIALSSAKDVSYRPEETCFSVFKRPRDIHRATTPPPGSEIAVRHANQQQGDAKRSKKRVRCRTQRRLI